MRAILDIVMMVLNLYTWVIIAGAILSWLIAFGVVNVRNDIVHSIWNLFLALSAAAAADPQLPAPGPAASTFRRSSSCRHCGADHHLLRLPEAC